MSFTNPLPSGTVGRTDQGVDVSAPAGSSILAIAKEKLVSIIPNWYQGQPFALFQILGKNNQPTGQYDYAAEQINVTARPGRIIQQGQQVGTVASSGTGLEFGWATSAGQTLARATGGYTEGQATPAGKSFLASVFNKVGPNNAATQAGAAGGASSSLSQLWIEAGGSPALANTMAAIAMAESSGQVGATNSNTNGSTDRGLWQINSSHTQFDANQLLTDPLYNAKAAVSIEKSQGLSAWTTYTSGAFNQFMGGAATATYGGTRPGGSTAGSGSGSSGSGSGSGSDPFTADYAALTGTPRAAPAGTDFASYDVKSAVPFGSGQLSFGNLLSNPFKWWWDGFSNSVTNLENDIKGPEQIVTDTVGFMNFLVKFALNPFQWLRGVEFLTGLGLMTYGLNKLTRRGNPIASGANSVTRSIVSASPLGVASRHRIGYQRGRREAQTQAGVNQGRQNP